MRHFKSLLQATIIKPLLIALYLKIRLISHTTNILAMSLCLKWLMSQEIKTTENLKYRTIRRGMSRRGSPHHRVKTLHWECSAPLWRKRMDRTLQRTPSPDGQAGCSFHKRFAAEIPSQIWRREKLRSSNLNYKFFQQQHSLITPLDTAVLI
jgi:hypothetical protein